MKNLPVFDPFVDFERLFEGLTTARPRVSGGNPLPLDVFEKNGELVLKASLPGVKPEDIDLSIEDNLLTLRGETRFEDEHQDSKVYRREIATGSFVRSIRLPKDIDVNDVKATFENGLVTVTLKRTVEEKVALRIPITAAASIEAKGKSKNGSTN